MTDRTRRLLGNALLLAGTATFVVGAVASVVGYPPDVPVVVLGALALLLVGLGASLLADGRPTDRG